MNHGAHPHPLEGKLEPECRDVHTPMECAALSIAISLKRIADQLGDTGPYRDDCPECKGVGEIPTYSSDPASPVERCFECDGTGKKK